MRGPAPSLCWSTICLILSEFIAIGLIPPRRCGIRYAKRRRYEEDLRRRMSVSALLTTDATPRKRVRPEEEEGVVKTEST